MGRWLGGIRDKHGKSVMEVFHELPPDDKRQILAALAAKLLVGTAAQFSS
jgi:hypothetical protein